MPRKYYNFMVTTIAIDLLDNSKIKTETTVVVTTKNDQNEYILILDNPKFKNNFINFMKIKSIFQDVLLDSNNFTSNSKCYDRDLFNIIMISDIFNDVVHHYINNGKLMFVRFHNDINVVRNDHKDDPNIKIVETLVKVRNNITNTINNIIDNYGWREDFNAIIEDIEDIHYN